jgi:hypothetical protein
MSDLGYKYAAVLAATINIKMEKILLGEKFEYIQFPKSCYE